MCELKNELDFSFNVSLKELQNMKHKAIKTQESTEIGVVHVYMKNLFIGL